MKIYKEIAIIIFLSIPVIVAGFVSWGIAKNIDKIGVDGWKKLYALNKVLINFHYHPITPKFAHFLSFLDLKSIHSQIS